jgi:hypothetical protein
LLLVGFYGPVGGKIFYEIGACYSLFLRLVCFLVADDRKLNVLFFGACIIAAVRLAREEIRNTPRVMGRVGEAVELARMILRYLDRDQPTAKSGARD